MTARGTPVRVDVPVVTVALAVPVELLRHHRLEVPRAVPWALAALVIAAWLARAL